ncbi:MAG: helix-turn-helix domain-containing protein [Gelidibacter sp.]
MLKTLQIIALIQGIFVLTVLFINRKSYKKATFWLLFGSLVSVTLYIIGDDQNNLFAPGEDWFLFDSSLFVTFLFLFFRYYKNGRTTFVIWDLVFFLPNLIYFIIEIIELVLQREVFFVEIFEIPTQLTFFIYLVWIVYNIYTSEKKHWILYFAIMAAVLHGFSSLNDILRLFDVKEFAFFNDENFNTYLLLVVAFLFYFIAYNLMDRQKSILPKIDSEKYKNSNLNDSLILHHKMALIEAMEDKKLYLNGKLSIHDVSEQLNIPRQYISEVLNLHMETNFQDFVNAYRVEEFINRLKNDQNDHFTLLAIAMDVGFNSKSSFNATFKKFKGVTPTEYKKQLLLKGQ